ncbi:MAG: hypothetical protein J7493_10460 [Porphyrobacter sp.]|nr:hypothetical protein [Porphyrobacter sp.]
MIPNHIRTEIQRRIRLAEDINPDLLRALNIEPNACPEDPEEPLEFFSSSTLPLPGRGEPIRGHILFDLALSALGESVTHSCRGSYVITFYDEAFDGERESARLMCEMAMRYEVLDWDDPDACDENTGAPLPLAVPRWREVNLFPIIPRAIEAKLDDLIEEQALALERRLLGKSTS